MTGTTHKESSWLKRHITLFHNWVSVAGGIIILGSILAFLILMALEATSGSTNAYIGILAYLVAPGFFVLGSTVGLLGWILERRSHSSIRIRDRDRSIDLSRPRDRRILMVFFGGALGFLVITFIGSYQTYQFTESNVFCGLVCHTQMEPQYARSMKSPHASISCVECHVGSDAESYLQAKAGGVPKVWGALTGDYPRPIKIKSESAATAQQACMECHWEERSDMGLELKSYEHYLSDEENTPFTVNMLLDLGFGNSEKPYGVHWHIAPGTSLEYVMKENEFEELLAVWTRITHPDGKVEEFRMPGYSETPDPSEIRRMNCLTCHNRPAHTFEAPNDAIERGLHSGSISASLPEIKRIAAEAMSEDFETKEEGLASIAAYLSDKYKGAEDEGTVNAIQTIYRENFYPEMKTDWRSYPENTGHKDSLGCFRCHNEELANVNTQKVVSRDDCSMCHSVLSQGSGEELKSIMWAGLEFEHPDGGYSGLTCADCHTGGIPAE